MISTSEIDAIVILLRVVGLSQEIVIIAKR